MKGALISFVLGASFGFGLAIGEIATVEGHPPSEIMRRLKVQILKL